MLLPFKSGRRSKISASSALATDAFGVPLLRPPTSRIGEPWADRQTPLNLVENDPKQTFRLR